MATKTADFEKGSNGATIATGDAGSADAWNNLFGTTPTYDNTHAAHGALSAKMTTGQILDWTGSGSESWGRLYLWLSASSPSTVTDIVQMRLSGAVNVELQINASMKMVATDHVSAGATGSVSVATGQWVRIEYHIINSATVGFLEMKLFNTADSITADETITSASNRNTGASIDQLRLGYLSGNAGGATMWVDQAVGLAAAYPGPFPVSTTAPGVTGTPTLGSTLTCDGGTWNSGGTFTLTYQWQRDVLGNFSYSNIGGATSSTYTLVLGDDLCNIRCVVTATGVVATNESATANSNASLDTSGGTIFALPQCFHNHAVLRAALR